MTTTYAKALQNDSQFKPVNCVRTYTLKQFAAAVAVV